MTCAACEAGWVSLELDGVKCHPNPRDSGRSWRPCAAVMPPESGFAAWWAEVVPTYPYKSRAEEDAALDGT